MSNLNQDTFCDKSIYLFLFCFPSVRRKGMMGPVHAGSIMTMVLVWLPGLIT